MRRIRVSFPFLICSAEKTLEFSRSTFILRRESILPIPAARREDGRRPASLILTILVYSPPTLPPPPPPAPPRRDSTGQKQEEKWNREVSGFCTQRERKVVKKRGLEQSCSRRRRRDGLQERGERPPTLVGRQPGPAGGQSCSQVRVPPPVHPNWKGRFSGWVWSSQGRRSFIRNYNLSRLSSLTHLST